MAEPSAKESAAEESTATPAEESTAATAEKPAEESHEEGLDDSLDQRASLDELAELDELDDLDELDESANRVGLTPRQARRIRIVLASVLMAAMAVVLVVRLASRTSVLVVGVYGAALVLCGVVIELSRHGRTRLGTWMLGIGLAAALAADWLLLP
ncbi:hypothetical protein AB0G35_25010 [Streptomyces sp. NPDC021749]|uniref:hypothetical protein n=1 Tax=Streptomyces sp. NPDC021749 TaxID=3154905 RepID=UPI00340143F9